MTNGPFSSDALPDDVLQRLLAERAWLVRLARGLAADEATAADLAQETWATALRSPPLEATHPRSWLATVMRRLARKSRRTDSRRVARERIAAERVGPTLGDDPVAALERVELRRQVARAVLALDEPYRTAVVLRWFEDHSVASIAQEAGISEAGVRSRLRRGLAQLRERLDAEHGGDRRAWLAPLLTFGSGAAPAPQPSSPVPSPGPSLDSVWTTLAGGAVMTAQTKLLLGAGTALVLLLLAATWFVQANSASPPGIRLAGSRAAEDEPSTNESARRRRGDRARTDLAESDASAGPVDRDRDVHGLVVDESGLPLEGVTVTALDASARRIWLPGDPREHERASGPAVRTDAAGAFRLRLRPGQLVDLRAEQADAAALEVSNVTAGERVRIVMRPSVSAELRVVDVRGAPIADAALVVHRGPRTADVSFRRKARTDDDGKVTIDGLPPDVTAWAQATHPQFGTAPLVTFLTRRDRTETIEVVLPDGRTIAGTVVSAVNGEPVEGATVGTLFRPQGVITDASGQFRLSGVGVQDTVLRVTATGFAPLQVDAPAVATPDDAGRPATPSLEVRLTPGRAVTGRVIAADGAPIAGAAVAGLVWQRGRSGLPASQASSHQVTDTDGRFRVVDLPREAAATLVFRAAGHARWLRNVPAGNDLDVGDIRLPPPQELAVDVVWSDGTPAARIQGQLLGGNLNRGLAPAGVPESIGATELRYSDDLGRIRFPGLPPGAYTVSVGPSGQERTELAVMLAEDSARTAVRIELPGLDELKVRVRTPDGQPVPAVQVVAFGAQRSAGNAITDAQGNASLRPERSVERVCVRLGAAAERRWLPPPERPVGPGERDVTLVLEEGQPVRCRVLTGAGTPLPDAHVAVEIRAKGRYDGRKQTVLTGADGTFTVLVPEGGRIDARLTGTGRGTLAQIQRGEGDVEQASAGQWTGLSASDGVHELHATPLEEGSVRVRLVTPDGRGVPGAKILSRIGQRVVRDEDVRTDGEGRAVWDGLPLRKRQIEVELDGARLPPGDWIDPLPVEVTPGSGEVALRLRPALRISGKVVRADGQAVGYCGVSVEHEKRRLGGTTSAADGTFSVLIPQDAPARLRLEVITYDRARRRGVGVVRDVSPGATDVVIRVEMEE